MCLELWSSLGDDLWHWECVIHQGRERVDCCYLERAKLHRNGATCRSIQRSPVRGLCLLSQTSLRPQHALGEWEGGL